MTEKRDQLSPSRREFLQLLGGGAAALTVGDVGIARAAEYFRPSASASYVLNVAPFRADLGGGNRVSTIGFNDTLPGPLLRLKQGERLRAKVTNGLSAGGTSVHWHGIPLINKMDGVPGLTQKPIAPGADFQYDFKVPVAGTYWYHSHSAAQSDRGVYGPLIVDAASEELSYDREVVLVLDDWRDGMGRRASGLASLCECQLGFTQHSVQRGAPPAEPTSYPLHIINGRAPAAPTQVTLKRGETVRLRIINAGSATVYRIALGGHTMRVTHADGQPVKPVDVETLDIGMAERYDVLIHANHPGVWQFAAQPSSVGPIARAVFRYDGAQGATPPAGYKPKQLKGKRLTYRMLRAAGDYGRPRGKPDISMDLTLDSRFGAFFILFNGRALDAGTPLHIPRNSHVRFNITNNSVQIHPMHLHGHFFQVNNGTGNGPMKDTLMLTPSQRYTVDWMANNPGLWVIHCHNLYHMLNGMMHTLKVS